MRRARPSQTRGRSPGAGGFSLFPFLAVLICTLGALIILLVVLARQARIQATEAARTKAAEAAVDLKQLKADREMVQWQASQLQESRVKTEAQLAEARLQLGAVEDHMRQLRDELARLKSAWDELDRTAAGGARERNQCETDLVQLRAQIVAAEKQLADELKAVEGRRRSFAIIPYDGPNPTRRRPIYIECRANAIVLQPEGIALSETDFEGPLGPGNPLAAALRASREYLAGRGETAKDGSDEPYPLLLVRPDGVAAYYAARGAMDSWASEFGYELIGQDWKLHYQPPDPELASVISRAVQTARVRQNLLAQIAPRNAGSRHKPTYRAGTVGIVREDAGDDSDPPRRADRPALGSGLGGTGSGGFGSGRTRSGGIGSGDVAGGRGPQALGVGGNAPGGPDLGAAGPAGVSPGGAGSTAGTSGSPDGSPLSTGGSGAAGGSQPGGDGTPMSGTNSGEGQASLGGAPGSAPGGQAAVFGSRFESGRTTAARKGMGGGTGSGNETLGSPTTARPEGYIAGRPGEPDPNEPSSGQAGRPLRPGEWEPRPPSRSKKSDAEPENRDPDANKTQIHASTLDEKKPARRKPLDARGRDWGLPNASAGSVPITRPIRVDCYPDRFVIAPHGQQGGRVVHVGPQTKDSVNEFVSAVWEQMDTWGIAGRGMYWRPVISVHVAPGGEQRSEDLKTLLEGSGLQVESKIRN
jgi:hypothetical protein